MIGDKAEVDSNWKVSMHILSIVLSMFTAIKTQFYHLCPSLAGARCLPILTKYPFILFINLLLMSRNF